MFNKQIENYDGCEIQFIYANTILTNISFAEVSLKYIFNDTMMNDDVYENKHVYYFFHIQSLLNACGAIINVLRPYGKDPHYTRGKKLRELFGISLSDYKLIFQKEARNTSEHFDERYAEFGYRIGDYNLLDINTLPTEREEILTSSHLRTYDIESRIYHTYIRKSYQLQRYSLNLNDMEEELQKLKVAILSCEYYISKANIYFAT